MKPRMTCAFAIVIAVAGASAAKAQDTPAKAKLRDTIAEKCEAASFTPADPLGANGEVKPDVLAAALSGAAPLKVKVAWMSRQDAAGQPVPLARTIADAALQLPDARDENLNSLNLLYHLAASWTTAAGEGDGLPLPLKSGGVIVRRRNGGVLPEDDPTRGAVLAAMLSGSPEYSYRCIRMRPTPPDGTGVRDPDAGPPRPAAPGAKDPPFRWALARTPADLSKPPPTELRGKDDKTYAEFGFTADDVKDVDSYTIDAALGAVFDTLGVGRPFQATPTLFAQIQRKGTSAPGSSGDVNNLNFGGVVAGLVSPEWGGRRRFFYYDLAAKYLTDDDFESRAYQAALRIDPPLPLPGYRVGRELARGDDLRVYGWWTSTVVADWTQVDDPGEKTNLLTAPEFARIGYDLSGHILWLPADPRTRLSIQLDMNYSVRDGQTEDGGDAQLVNIALRWLPDPRYSFGLAYERGENLDSLERIDIWKLVLGARF